MFEHRFPADWLLQWLSPSNTADDDCVLEGQATFCWNRGATSRKSVFSVSNWPASTASEQPSSSVIGRADGSCRPVRKCSESGSFTGTWSETGSSSQLACVVVSEIIIRWRFSLLSALVHWTSARWQRDACVVLSTACDWSHMTADDLCELMSPSQIRHQC